MPERTKIPEGFQPENKIRSRLVFLLSALISSCSSTQNTNDRNPVIDKCPREELLALSEIALRAVVSRKISENQIILVDQLSHQVDQNCDPLTKSMKDEFYKNIMTIYLKHGKSDETKIPKLDGESETQQKLLESPEQLPKHPGK